MQLWCQESQSSAGIEICKGHWGQQDLLLLHSLKSLSKENKGLLLSEDSDLVTAGTDKAFLDWAFAGKVSWPHVCC